MKSCYDSSKNLVSLCGVGFSLDTVHSYKKADIVDIIYQCVFGTTKKEINTLNQAIKKYEGVESDLDKAILFPSIILADELIKKINDIEYKFNEYSKTLSFEEKKEFDTTFKRSGVTDVIQNSTYIDKPAIRQIIPAHQKQIFAIGTMANGIKNNKFKYIDGDADCDKALRVINQIEKLKINSDTKFTLKFRKLGNLKANGVYFST